MENLDTFEIVRRMREAKARGEKFITVTQEENDLLLREMKPLFQGAAPSASATREGTASGFEVRVVEPVR